EFTKGLCSASLWRRSRSRIVGPCVLGISAAKLLSNFGITVLPETREVRGDLLRAVIRPQQMEQYGHAPPADRWRFQYAEEFLDSHGQYGRFAEFVSDRMAVAVG